MQGNNVSHFGFDCFRENRLYLKFDLHVVRDVRERLNVEHNHHARPHHTKGAVYPHRPNILAQYDVSS